jgi:predicted lipoprotein with Yx(FWY)xxD motif
MGIHREPCIIAMTAAVLGLAACATSTPIGASPSSAPSRPVQVAVGTLPGGSGQYLTDAAGRSLYLFASDTATRSMCNAACAIAWPPLPGAATAGTGVTATLTSITRDDGSAQAACHGHPLYYFENDRAPGDIKGEGLNTSGGRWYLLDPAGNAITSTAPPTGVAPFGGY